MLILGLDVATRTGECWMDRSQQPSSWRCRAAISEGENAEEKAGDLAAYFNKEFWERKPDFAAIEMPLRSVVRFEKKPKKQRADLATGSGDSVSGSPESTINPNALMLSSLAGAVVAALEINRIPWGLVAPATWRKAYYGKGWKPADGNWKKAAIAQANIQGIILPDSVEAQRDAAEAVGIAIAWQWCTFIPRKHQIAFMDLRTGKARAA